MFIVWPQSSLSGFSITSVFTAGYGAKVSINIDKILLRKIFAIFLLLTCASLIIEHFII